MKTLTIFALAFALLTVDARASFSGEGPLTDPEALTLVELSVKEWRSKGLDACPELRTFAADSLWHPENPNPAGLGGECRLWVARGAWANMDKRQRCIVILHEVGHALGLPHAADHVGVMAKYPYDQLVPMCEAYAYAPMTVLTAPEARRATRLVAYDQGLRKGVKVRLPLCKSSGQDQVCRIAWKAQKARHELTAVVRKTVQGVEVMNVSIRVKRLTTR